MKNIITSLMLLSVLTLVVVPMVVSGADDTNLPVPQTFPEAGPKTTAEFLARIGSIGNFLFAIFLSIAIIFIVWSAVQFVTAQGDPTKISTARTAMMWSFIGIGFALLAAFFDNIAASILNITITETP